MLRVSLDLEAGGRDQNPGVPQQGNAHANAIGLRFFDIIA
jgi:hypothetical protein